MVRAVSEEVEPKNVETIVDNSDKTGGEQAKHRTSGPSIDRYMQVNTTYGRKSEWVGNAYSLSPLSMSSPSTKL